MGICLTHETVATIKRGDRKPMGDPPSGTVTFLFTDLEGSTRLWEDYPDAIPEALAQHDTILRDAVESAGGHVVKTTGDGFFAAFGRADAALTAALAAQRALAAAAWPETGPLLVRVGLHTGDVEFREGDYHGQAVNRAARLMTAGHGGQVLVSGATALLVGERLREDTELIALGGHRLRDLGRSTEPPAAQTQPIEHACRPSCSGPPESLKALSALVVRIGDNFTGSPASAIDQWRYRSRTQPLAARPSDVDGRAASPVRYGRQV